MMSVLLLLCSSSAASAAGGFGNPNMLQVSIDIRTSRALECGACLAVVDSLHRKLGAELPQSCVAKGGTDSRGRRTGACTDFSLSELRMSLLLEGLCADMVQYVRAVYHNGTMQRRCAAPQQLWNGTHCLFVRYERYDGRSGVIQGHFLRRLLGQQQSIKEGRELQFYCDGWLEQHEDQVAALLRQRNARALASLQSKLCVAGAVICSKGDMVARLQPPPLMEDWEVASMSRERDRRQVLERGKKNEPGVAGFQPFFFPDESLAAKRQRLARGQLPAFDALARSWRSGADVSDVIAQASALLARARPDERTSAEFYHEALRRLAAPGVGGAQWLRATTLRLLAELQAVDELTWEAVLADGDVREAHQRQLNILRAFKPKRNKRRRRRNRVGAKATNE